MLANLPTPLLPGVPRLQLETVDVDPAGITLEVASIQKTPACPACGHLAHRIHSDYVRTLADLPWPELPVRIRLRVRRFFCDQLTCPRTTFTEQLHALASPYARRTQRLAAAQCEVALALGGAAGARLAAKQHMPTSRQTLLRLPRQMPLPPAAPRVVGLDDWAKRKGHTYGTIVVDLETHDPIDLLDDRSAETVETWLRAHPTVEVVGRDRSETYASGATAGAPDAVQVADRWHILKNLHEAIEQELAQRRVQVARGAPVDLPATEAAPVTSVPRTSPNETPNKPADSVPAGGPIVGHSRSVTPSSRQAGRLRVYPDTHAGRRAEAARGERRTARFEQYTHMVALRNEGLDRPTIARRIGVQDRGQ